MVAPTEDNQKALAEICEKYRVRLLHLHGDASTGEDMPDGKSELDLLVEFFPMSEMEHAKIHFALEDALRTFFGRKVGLLRTDDIKPDFLKKQLTRRRTLLYAAQGQDES